MNRHEEREKLVQLLFDLDFHEIGDYKEQMDLFRRIHMPQDADSFEHVKSKALAIIDKRGEIDMLLTKLSTGWPLNRMGKSELCILRVAVYEMLFDDSIPAAVSINEAVELSKAYGGDSAPSFVNGVLAKFTKEKTAE